MVIDSSAIIAILEDEAGAAALVNAIQRAATRLIGAPTALEASIVAYARRGPTGPSFVDELLRELDVTVVEFAGPELNWAARAYERYGKGIDRPGLNFGDCLTYGVARAQRQPLLCTGSEFARTDLDIVHY